MANIQNKEATTTVKEDIAGDEFLSTLQSHMLNQSKAISSANTNIERKIQDSISSLEKSNVASRQATESAFNRQISATREAGGFQFTGAQEEQRGFATNVGILKKINEDTATSIKDLEQRKQEVILQGDAATAAKIADLQLKALEYQQQASQQVFSNLLAMSNFGLSVRSEKRQQQAQDFAERSAISNIALEFGIPVNENDTIDTIIARAAPFVDEERQLKLEQIRADIANSKAQTARALKGDPSEKPFDPLTALTLAQAYRNGQVEFMGGIKTNEQSAAVYDAIQMLEMKDEEDLKNLAGNYTNATEFNRAVLQKSGGMNEASKANYQRIAAKVAADTYTNKQTAPKNIVGGKFLEALNKKGQGQDKNGIIGGLLGNIF